jgi:hypothetical protein
MTAPIAAPSARFPPACVPAARRFPPRHAAASQQVLHSCAPQPFPPFKNLIDRKQFCGWSFAMIHRRHTALTARLCKQQTGNPVARLHTGQQAAFMARGAMADFNQRTQNEKNT